MTNYCYVIENDLGQRYIGATSDLSRRIEEHNRGQNNSTRGKGPWQLIYSEAFSTILEAKTREAEMKRKKRKSYIDWLISQNNGSVV